MKSPAPGPISLHIATERWPLSAPFRLTGRTYEAIEVIVVTLGKDGHQGRGEARGVPYKNENPASMRQQLHSIQATLETTGLTRDSLPTILPPGGARNALDCALWDLEAKLTRCPAWQLAGLEKPRPLLAVYTCGADDPSRMADAARAYTDARAIKLKLTGEPVDRDRVIAVRQARPDVWLSVDANQGFTRASLDQLIPVLADARVAVIEQPFPVGQEHLLEGLCSPIPIAADESVQSLTDIDGFPGRFNIVNIKLDKCGGLTEALAMARAAQRHGLSTWAGNMFGTSLAMAPAFLLGQLCSVVELDGPLFLKSDREVTLRFTDGYVTCPEALWGAAA